MSLQVREEPLGLLDEHARVPIAFTVDRTLAVSLRSDGLGGILLNERLADSPYVKDHDGEGEDPTHWPERFETSRWGLIAAHDVDRRVGGAVIAFQSADVWMLEGRADLAALWDLRVLPEVRNMGVGTQLFHYGQIMANQEFCSNCRGKKLPLTSGGSGIRTHGGLNLTAFQEPRICPLCHPSERQSG